MKPLESAILRAAARPLAWLLLAFSLHLLWRGHNWPGGGFVGGLVAGLVCLLLLLAEGPEAARKALRCDPTLLAAAGLALALGSAALPLLLGGDFLQHGHAVLPLPWGGGLALGTPLLFDAGVYLVVVGVTARFLLVLARPAEGLPSLDAAERRRYASPVEEPLELAEGSAVGERREPRP